jgi:phosphoglycerol transferase MdoB-like AlkP superfamily enzyme
VWLAELCAVALLLSTLVLGALLLRKWRRERRFPPLAPLTGLLVSIWAWSVYSSADPLLLYMVPALHSVQYLYFVWLLSKNQARAAERPPYFGPPARQRLLLLAAAALGLGFLLFHAAPELLDGARLSAHRRARETLGELGATPFFAALFVFVNVHHYFMDNVIWRRENPDTQYLRQ